MEDGPQLVALVRSLIQVGDREAGSEGERTCQERIAGLLAPLGMEATVEGAVCPARYPVVLGLHAVAFLLSALVATFSASWGLAFALLCTLSFWGELRDGPQILRRLLLRQITGNMVARQTKPQARARLLIVAHADAATATALFHPWVSRVVHWREKPGRTVHPGVLVLLAGLAQATAAVLWLFDVPGSAPAITLGGASFVHLGTLALAIDWWRAPAVEGALDNGSGLAVVVSAARILLPLMQHVELWVVATGDREPNSGGMSALLAQLQRSLDAPGTWVINVDDVGRGQLAIGTGEGRWKILPYRPTLPAMAEAVANRLGFDLPQVTVAGTTDAGPPTEAGMRAVTLLTLEDGHRPSEQHTRADVLSALDPATMVQARDFLIMLAQSVDEVVGNAGRAHP